jgi:hypothetical protein
MARRRIRPLRRRIFCGCEGESEQSYGTFLHQLVAERGDLHIDSQLLQPGAGDLLGAVERAYKLIQRKEREYGSRYKTRAIFLDADRLGQRPERDQQIAPLCATAQIHIVWQRPCHEALLLRHIDTHARPLYPTQALLELRRHWPEYQKASPARYLAGKFSLKDVWRACQVEEDLFAFLNAIRYFPPGYRK